MELGEGRSPQLELRKLEGGFRHTVEDFGTETSPGHGSKGAGGGGMAFVPEGQPLHEASKTQRFQYKVPESLYGTAIFMPVLVQETSCFERLRWHGLGYFWMSVSYTVQLLFLTGLFQYARAERLDPSDVDCEELHPGLLSAALFATTVSVLSDVQETYDLWYIVKKLVPTVDETTLLRFAEHPDRGDLELVGGGFSKRRKVCIVLLILLPKFAMAMGLLVTSFEYLTVTKRNMDVILDATALVFIIQIDVLLFSFFSSYEVRTIMRQFPDFDVSESKHARRRPFYQLLKFVISVTSVIVGLWYGWSPNRCEGRE